MSNPSPGPDPSGIIDLPVEALARSEWHEAEPAQPAITTLLEPDRDDRSLLRVVRVVARATGMPVRVNALVDRVMAEIDHAGRPPVDPIEWRCRRDRRAASIWAVLQQLGLENSDYRIASGHRPGGLDDWTGADRAGLVALSTPLHVASIASEGAPFRSGPAANADAATLDRLLGSSGRSLLLVPEASAEAECILVPLAGSDADAAVLPVASRLAAAKRVPLDILWIGGTADQDPATSLHLPPGTAAARIHRFTRLEAIAGMAALTAERPTLVVAAATAGPLAPAHAALRKQLMDATAALLILRPDFRLTAQFDAPSGPSPALTVTEPPAR